MRIIHHRAIAHAAGGKVVGEAQRVADFVRSQLAQAGQRHLLGQFVLSAGCFCRRRQQRFGDQDVLPHALRSQRDGAAQDLAGARIGQRIPVGPAARGAVHPGDDVVADVLRVHAFRQQLDAVGILEAGFLEGAGPPRCAFNQRRTHRLRRAAVDVVDDRFFTVLTAADGSVFSSLCRTCQCTSMLLASGVAKSK
jgi:nucleoside 2-deoxyribosyltransferase